MLILSRRKKESIRLTLPNGEIITICLLHVSSNVAKIGIDAPEGVVIVREELLEGEGQ